VHGDAYPLGLKRPVRCYRKVMSVELVSPVDLHCDRAGPIEKRCVAVNAPENDNPGSWNASVSIVDHEIGRCPQPERTVSELHLAFGLR
jgi:hypothetical protein